MRRWYIYSLIDPRTSAVRYVGWAFDVAKRVRDHISKARKQHSHKASWLVQLENDGLQPLYQVLESGTNEWAEAERRWIAYFREQGASLTNLTDGGEGIIGYVFSAETRRRMGDAKRGRKLTPEHIEKVVRHLRGRKRPPSVMAKVAATRTARGYRHSEETKEKIRQATIGRKRSEEANAKIIAAQRGRKHTDEAKRKQSEAKKGKPLTAEHRQKLAEAKRGKRLSEEHKQHIRDATQGRSQRCGICGETGHKRSTCPRRVT